MWTPLLAILHMEVARRLHRSFVAIVTGALGNYLGLERQRLADIPGNLLVKWTENSCSNNKIPEFSEFQ